MKILPSIVSLEVGQKNISIIIYFIVVFIVFYDFNMIVFMISIWFFNDFSMISIWLFLWFFMIFMRFFLLMCYDFLCFFNDSIWLFKWFAYDFLCAFGVFWCFSLILHLFMIVLMIALMILYGVSSCALFSQHMLWFFENAFNVLFKDDFFKAMFHDFWRVGFCMYDILLTIAFKIVWFSMRLRPDTLPFL